MTESEMLEEEKYWCEKCCNFDREHIRIDGFAKCRVTNTLAYAEECGRDCRAFNKPAENTLVLPCKVGDTVYIIKRCRCGNPHNFNIKQCHKKIVAKTPAILARVMEQEMCRRSKANGWKVEYEVVPIGTICYSIYKKPFTLKMLTEIGKTVFLTKEEAEKALQKG